MDFDDIEPNCLVFGIGFFIVGFIITGLMTHVDPNMPTAMKYLEGVVFGAITGVVGYFMAVRISNG